MMRAIMEGMLSEVFPIAVPLRRRDGTIRAHTLVDADDYEAVAKHRWYALAMNGLLYAYRGGGGRGRKKTALARELLGLKPGDRRRVDHKNFDTLDNRRSNLRIATTSQNAQNLVGPRASRSGVRGVYWHSPSSKWEAKAVLDYKQHHLGRFDTIAEAEAVVVAWRREHMPFSEMDKS